MIYGSAPAKFFFKRKTFIQKINKKKESKFPKKPTTAQKIEKKGQKRNNI